MSPEREQGHITLDQITSKAKEVMIQDGHHMPTLIVEGSKTLVGGQLNDLPNSHGERMQLMDALGQAAARSGRVDHLRKVIMISEGWLSMAKGDEPPAARPSQDPEKKEVLIISAVQLEEQKKTNGSV